MAEPTYISWNFANWITIVLMAALGMAIIGMVASFLRGNLPTAAQ